MKKVFLYFPIFLWASIASFEKIEKIQLFNMNIRLAYLVLIPPLLYWGSRFRFKDFLEKRDISFLLSLVLFSSFLSSFIFNDLSSRSLGFNIWLCLNVLITFMSLTFKSLPKVLISGYVFGHLISSIYLVISSFFYNYMFSQEEIIKNLFHGVFRSSGFSGEPSYFAVSVLPIVCYLYNHKFRFQKTLLLIFSLALMLSYSRLALLGLLFIPATFILISRKDFYKQLPIYFSINFTVLVISFVHCPGFYVPSSEKEIKSRKDVSVVVNKPKDAGARLNEKYEINTGLPMIDKESHSFRILSLKRGLIFSKEKFLTGVGLGNSHKALTDRFLGKTKDDYFVQGLHNLWLEIIVEVGILGLSSILLIALYPIFSGGISSSRVSFLFLLFVPMQFSQTLNISVIWIFLIMSLEGIKENHILNFNTNMLLGPLKKLKSIDSY